MRKKTWSLVVSLPLLCGALIGCGQTSNSNTSGVTSSSAPFTSESGSGNSSLSTSGGSSATSGQPVADAFSGIIRICYHNDTSTEANKNIYAWCTGLDGTEYTWDGALEGYGYYKDFDVGAAPWSGIFSDTFFFIIKSPGTWAGQSPDTEVKVSDYTSYITEEGGRKLLTVYAAEGEANSVNCYQKKADAVGDHFSTFNLNSDWTSMAVTSTGVCSSYTLYGFTSAYYALSASGKAIHLDEYIIKSGQPNAANFTINIGDCAYPNGTALTSVDPHTTYKIEGKFASAPTKRKSKCASAVALYDTPKFISDFTYSGDDLGCTYTPSASEFRVWAPTASRAQVWIYNSGTPSSLKDAKDPGRSTLDDAYNYYVMEAQAGGVYRVSIPGDLAGKFYIFSIYYNDTYVTVCDPYAKATGVNGVRAAILDPATTDPTGWSGFSLPSLSSPNQLTIYEAHIRDFTADKTWISNEGNSHGGYNAFHEAGTTYSAGGVSVKTGFDSLKEFGVNAVQFLPVFDQDNDERAVKTTDFSTGKTSIDNTAPGYNWGYNPQNYNVVEGAYSSDPFDPKVRMSEYKSLILDLSKAGIRTIMDVVYNHVSSISTNSLNRIVPKYYFRLDSQGFYYDGSGVGNVTSSERVMTRRFIVNSVCWWAKQYQVKGFRFDLMGCLDTDTLRAVKDALYAIDPSIVVYGEGWAGSADGFTGMTAGYTEAKTSGVYAKLADNGKGSVGCFNDGGRDGTKGNTQWANVTPSYGFVAQGSSDLSKDTKYKAANMWRGQNGNAYDYLSPDQTVDYVSCHDNYTLYDQMNYCVGNGMASDTDSLDAAAASVACTASVLFSQGIAFLQGGEEILRTKVMAKDDPYYDKMVASYGSHISGSSSWVAGDGIELKSGKWLVRNSYMYGDAVNSFKWDRKVTYKAYFDKMAEAVSIRNAKMGDLFGYSASKVVAGAVSLWGASDMDTNNTVIAANVASAKTSSAYYLIFGGRNTDTYSSIGIGNGGVEIVYTSSVPSIAIHTDGQSFTISNNLFGAGKYEFCLVKRVSNA